MIDRVVISCEHAGNRVPARYAGLFGRPSARRALSSHRGYDPGAWHVARLLARHLNAPLIACTTTRLLVEVNRSEHHPQVFSEFSRVLDRRERAPLLSGIYHRHRSLVSEALAEAMAGGRRVLHLGIHSFTPQLHGSVRRADIGLLYDPSRRLERAWCARCQAELRRRTGLRVRRNYPYRGITDGLTTALRRRFPAGRYLGIEVEINQRLLVGVSPSAVARLADHLQRSTNHT